MKKAILVKFGKKIRETRTKRGLSQEALADIANVHRTYIGMVERANIQKSAKALKIDIRDLFE